MLKLKRYQEQALEVLQDFLQQCRFSSVADAYRKVVQSQKRLGETYNTIFSDIPCVCLRVPTGGGKTLLAAHSISVVSQTLLDSDAPVALWLTPSDTIRSQTLQALSDIRHPYREALAKDFGDNVRVCDLESLQTVSAQDMGKACIVVVATIQSFNVTDTAKRNVYSFFEELAPHFDQLTHSQTSKLDKVTEDDIKVQPFLTNSDLGRVKLSVANWFNLHNPVVVVDEAHNNRTDRFFKTLGRLNPSCIVELTATPVPGNNVLYHVSAQELRAEQMIKLPIVLAEHPAGWQECVRDAVITRNGLEVSAQKETDYIRPIALIQAMPKGGEATVDVVKQHLINQENIPEEQIVVATGDQKGLDGINLFAADCPVRYVITVEALKEGWDCSFAYVLASLQSVNSSKDVEQLLGRVLRMPYAKDRKVLELNKAYAHIVAANFAEAASTLKDRLVQNMGFERLETASILVPQTSLDLTGGSFNTAQQSPTIYPVPTIPDCFIQVPKLPDTQHWPDDLKQQVEIKATSQGATIVIKGTVDSDTLAQAEQFLSAAFPTKTKESIAQQFTEHRAVKAAVRAPAQLGISFTPIPQLCLLLENHYELVERDTMANLMEWNLLDYPVQLEGFNIVETVNSFEIDVKGEQVKFKHIDAQQLKLNDVVSHITENDLVRWLDSQIRQPYLSQSTVRDYLLKMVTYLTKQKQFSLTALVRARFQLSKAIIQEIERVRAIAVTKGFQMKLSDMLFAPVEQQMNYCFIFQSGVYPARNIYRGSYEFNKHFYPMIHDLSEKTESGKQTEEFRCAMAIDAHPKVKHWVRNIERNEKASFWLPTATDYFYPDFIAELTDGRILAIEYKGAVYETNDDSREKRFIGEQWERSSDGRCLFLFAVKTDDFGRDVTKQLSDKIGGL